MSSWMQVNISSDPAQIEAISDFISGLTNRGLQIDDNHSHLWELTGFLDQGDRGQSQLRLLQEYLHSLPQPYTLATNALPDQDWHENWRQNFAPFQMSQHIWISPPWQSATLSPGQFAIIIDPGQAFGTGQHESTRLCLLTLERLSQQRTLPSAALDVGCGTGILAIAFLKLGGQRALGIDIDPLALEAAAHNAALNNASALELSAALLQELEQPFPLVLANLTALDLVQLAPHISRQVAVGGRLLCAGLLVSQVQQVIQAFSNFKLDEQNDLNGWSCLLLSKTGA